MNIPMRIIGAVLLISYARAYGQDAGRADSLVREGNRLSNAGKYNEAVTDYQQAIKADPGNSKARYQLSFALKAAGHDQEAIPYLEKLGQESNPYSVNALNLLGSIYDNSKQPQKAIQAYSTGLKLDPKNRELYYNLAIVYYKQQKFADAEHNLAEALKIEPANALTHRMYALSAFHEGKNAVCVMAFCNFLLLDPQSPQAAEAYTNIEHIFAGSAAIKTAGKTADFAYDKFIAPAQSASKNTSGASEKMAARLKVFFNLCGEAASKEGAKDFFTAFYADYFYKLTQAGHSAVLGWMIGQSVNKDEWAKWQAAHNAEAQALNDWVKNTSHGF